MAGLKLEGIRKAYGTNVVLEGVDLEIADGEFIVLVGPSGCGKSTLLRCVAGLEDITAGDLYIGERRVNDVPPKDRDIAMVFQSYALYPHMTVRENMAFGLRIRRLDKRDIDARVDETAKMLGLETLLERFPRQMSGGQRQRVAMGRAIVRRPEVFLFDEPLSNLDAALRVQMRAELARLHQRMSATMIYVTHDQVEAMTLADRIVVLNAGDVQQVGSPLELYHRPANRFVAGFIGSPAMNFLPGRLVGEEGGQGVVEVLDGRVRLPAGRTLPDAGRPLAVGIRPENLLLARGGGELEGTVEVTEPMGFETHLHVRVGDEAEGQVVIARAEAVDAVGIRPGQRVPLHLPADLVHLFDAETGEAVGYPPGGDEAVDQPAAVA